MGPLEAATDAAIAAASHLTPMDDGAVEALRAVARKIDTDDAVRGAFLAWNAGEGDRPWRPLQLDNVSLPTYLKFCDALGLTPAGRASQAGKQPKTAPVGTLTALRSRRGA